MPLRSWFVCLFGLLVALAVDANSGRLDAADPLDWPYWRGPEMNGISREKDLPSSWSPEGENLIWSKPGLGTRSTPIVMNGNLYTMVRHNPATTKEAEKVVCVDAATGETKWESIFNAFLTDVPDTRVGWSSVVGDPVTGNVFALGVCGYFQCLDGATGKTIWSHSMSEEYGLLSTYGGRTNFPIVFDNLVIISGVVIGWGEMARPAHRIIAFDKRNGQAVWFQSTKPFPEDTTYSSPAITVINGEAQYVIGCGDGSVYGIQPRTGKIIWNYDVSIRGINTPPTVVGSTVLCGHSEENLDDTAMGALFAIDASKSGNLTKIGELWRTKEEYIGKTAPLVIDDRVYSVDDGGIFFVNDLKTGKQIGKKKIGTMGRGSPVYGDGKLYVVDGNGRWFIFTPDAKGLKQIHTLRLEQGDVNASPIISHGRIYLACETMMYCIGKPDVKPSADPIPPMPKESPVDEDKKPATALVVPVESLLKPENKQQFSVQLYNAKGQFLKVADAREAKYTLQGPGTIDAAGKYTGPGGKVNNAVLVNAEVGELKSQARIRVVPEITAETPWSLTFDDGVVPVTAVGIRYRHIAIDHDYYQDLRSKDPLAAKMYIYLTTQFTNVPAPKATLDDSTPAQAFTGFKRYLGLIEAISNQDQAKEKLDPSLKLLQSDGVIANWEWTGNDKIPVQLVIGKGTRKVAGNGVLCKITTIPKGTRSQGWLGHPGSKNYTIQADVFANPTDAGIDADKNAKTPDIGLTNQRYRFEMMGAAQKLKLYSWIPHDRKFHEVDFPWQTGVWYTMKFIVTNETRDGALVSVCQGKVWKRGEAEPESWSIEWADSPANENGSPGLTGNAKDAEIFIDNVKVTPR
ncbi:PQQ-like beta-propeller repeat protein [Schlesneria paludicola]|uniref:PQQ-like beta-propeller repeat protein n=1 Tax=Schlesneria paludicola TaxID=360056 RepID=UPI00029A4452|nr:PQQ-like beta-propeller repeat protein [Schlesneria paludicola]